MCPAAVAPPGAFTGNVGRELFNVRHELNMTTTSLNFPTHSRYRLQRAMPRLAQLWWYGHILQREFLCHRGTSIVCAELGIRLEVS
jgi:hypothetical protein